MDAKFLTPETQGNHVVDIFVSLYVIQTYILNNIIIQHLVVKISWV